jgi:hypothetical protein
VQAKEEGLSDNSRRSLKPRTLSGQPKTSETEKLLIHQGRSNGSVGLKEAAHSPIAAEKRRPLTALALSIDPSI